VAVFQLFDGSRGRSVSIQFDEHLALIVILADGKLLRQTLLCSRLNQPLSRPEEPRLDGVLIQSG
jgi:hypothetical protein